MPVMRNGESKYSTIFNDLLGEIRDGTFHDSEQLPSERALAVKYGVTRMTARRALSHLTEMGLVERRGARGTVIRNGRAGKSSVTVSLVCAPESRADIEEFLHCGITQTRRRNWGARVVRMERHDETHLLRALSIGNPCLILGQPFEFHRTGPLQRALRKAAGRCAVIGTQMNFLGVASIVGDDSAGLALACQHLRRNDHRCVALVSETLPPDHPTMTVERQAWRHGFADVMDEHVAAANDVVVPKGASPYESVALTAYAAVRAFLASEASRQTTALICLGRELADGAVAAARDTGRPVPQKLSLLQYGGTRDWQLYNPPRDCIDVHMDRHVAAALDVLERNITDRPAPRATRAAAPRPEAASHLHLIAPELVCHGSVRTAQ